MNVIFPKKRELFIGLSVGMVAVMISMGSIYSPYMMLAASMMFLLTFLTRKVELFFYVFICSLMLMPKMTIGGINIRLEDGIAIFFAAQITLLWMSRKELGIPHGLLKAIFVYLGFSVLITLTHMIFGSLSPVYIMYWLKEAQYFLYFAIAFYCTTKHDKLFNRMLSALFILNLGWGLYQLVSQRSFGFYGVGMISEPASSQSGGAFFIITVYMFYLLQRAVTRKSKVLFLGLSGLGFVIVLSTVSRTAITALLFTCLVFLPLYLFEVKKRVVRLYYTAWLLILLYFAFPFITDLMGDIVTVITQRVSETGGGANTRMDKWVHLLSFNESFSSKMLGMGKGFAQTVTGGYTLAVDSQYVRFLMEVGAVGLVLFLTVIFWIIRFSLKNWKTARPESMFLLMMSVGFLVMSFTHEVFAVVVQGSMFWMMTGIFIAKITTMRDAQ